MSEASNFQNEAKAAFDVSQSAVTPSAAEAFTARAKAAGLSDEAIAKTLGAHKVSSQPPAAPPKRASSVVVDSLDAAKLPSLSDRQKMAAADQLSKFWTGDPDELRQALEAAGLTEVDADEDPRGEAEQAFDQSTLAPAASPDDYHLNYAGRAGELDIAGIAATDGDFRNNFAAASVPPAMAQGVLDALMQSADEYGARAEGPAQAIYKNEQRYQLSKFGDPERLMLLASLPYGRMSQEFRDALHENGYLESAVVIRRLAQVGELILHREQLAKNRK